jgi:hypothetical protein
VQAIWDHPEAISQQFATHQAVATKQRLGSICGQPGPPTFIPALNRQQIAERRCDYGDSKKAVSVERNSVGTEQLLEPLSLIRDGPLTA